MKQIFIILLSVILLTSCGKVKDTAPAELATASHSSEVQPVPQPGNSTPPTTPDIPDVDEVPADSEIPPVSESHDSGQPTAAEEKMPQPEPASKQTQEPTADPMPEPLPDTSATIPQPPEMANAAIEEPVHSEPEPPAETKTVSMEVFGLNKEIIFSATAEHREGITVFDLLTQQAREKNIPVVFSGGKSSAYITGINGLSEKANGPESGWIYTVNNKMVMKSCSKCVLNPGDTVQWTYITEFVPLN